MPTDQPVNLLALDGGGVRGVSELVMLDRIMRKIQELNKLEEVPKPCEFFDLMAGTSTGGLVAILLGRLQMSTTEALEAYDQFAEKIFSSKNKSSYWRTARHGSMFKAHTLKLAVQDLVSSRGKGDMMLDPEPQDKGRVFVCARPSNAKSGTYRRFRSYEPDGEAWGKDCKIWEAARATSAAPFFFESMKVTSNGTSETYVDAALGCNNPLNELLREAADVFGKERRIGCIVSLGTGTKSLPKNLGTPVGIINTVRWAVEVVKVLKELAVDTEKDGYEVNERLRRFKGTMFRLNVEGGADNINLNNYQMIEELKKRTYDYMDDPEIERNLQDIAERLAGHKMTSGLTIGHVCFLDRDQIMTANGSANLGGYPSSYFVGREKILKSLARHFEARSGNVSERQKRRVLLHGMGGAGKTQIARKFVEDYRNRFKHTFWVDATTKVTIEESYAAIALTIFSGEEAKTASIQDVLDWFDRCRDEWLLVLDNWTNDHSLLSLPQRNRGNYLFTSRETFLDNLQEEYVIHVDEMGEEDAITLLLRSSGDDPDFILNRQAGEEIVRELGYLPLAIDQAGAYIGSVNGTHISKYLGVFRKQKKAMLSHPIFRGRSKENLTLFATFDLTYKRLVDASRGSLSSENAIAARSALQVLHIICFYHNEGITRRFFSRSAFIRSIHTDSPYFPLEGNNSPKALLGLSEDGDWDPKLTDMGFKRLEEMSILKKTSAWTWSMHVLIHNWARDRMDGSTRARQALMAKALLYDSIQPKNRSTDDIVYYRSLLPHILACEELLPLPTSPGTAMEERVYQSWQRDQLFMKKEDIKEQELQKPGQARDTTKAIELSTTADSAIPDKYLPWNNQVFESEYAFKLSQVYIDLSIFNEVEKYLKMALQGMIIEYGPNSRESLRVLAAMGHAAITVGRYDDAETIYTQSLEGYKQYLGDSDATTLGLKRQLVKLWSFREKPSERAEKLMLEVRNTTHAVHGKDSWVAICDDLLLEDTRYGRNRDSEAGENDLFLARCRKYEMAEERYGDNNLLTIDAKKDVAHSLSRLGRHQDAVRYFMEIQETQEQIYGPESAEALRSADTIIANLLVEFDAQEVRPDRYKVLQTWAKEVFDKSQKLLGPYHPMTINRLARWANCGLHEGHTKEAADLLDGAVELACEAYGSDHIVTEEYRVWVRDLRKHEHFTAEHIMKAWRYNKAKKKQGQANLTLQVALQENNQ